MYVLFRMYLILTVCIVLYLLSPVYARQCDRANKKYHNFTSNSDKASVVFGKPVVVEWRRRHEK